MWILHNKNNSPPDPIKSLLTRTRIHPQLNYCKGSIFLHKMLNAPVFFHIHYLFMNIFAQFNRQVRTQLNKLCFGFTTHCETWVYVSKIFPQGKESSYTVPRRCNYSLGGGGPRPRPTIGLLHSACHVRQYAFKLAHNNAVYCN